MQQSWSGDWHPHAFHRLHETLAAGSAEALAARKAEQAETQRLKREVKRLEEEVEILRKAAAFFAKRAA